MGLNMIGEARQGETEFMDTGVRDLLPQPPLARHEP